MAAAAIRYADYTLKCLWLLDSDESISETRKCSHTMTPNDIVCMLWFWISIQGHENRSATEAISLYLFPNKILQKIIVKTSISHVNLLQHVILHHFGSSGQTSFEGARRRRLWNPLHLAAHWFSSMWNSPFCKRVKHLINTLVWLFRVQHDLNFPPKNYMTDSRTLSHIIWVLHRFIQAELWWIHQGTVTAAIRQGLLLLTHRASHGSALSKHCSTDSKTHKPEVLTLQNIQYMWYDRYYDHVWTTVSAVFGSARSLMQPSTRNAWCATAVRTTAIFTMLNVWIAELGLITSGLCMYVYVLRLNICKHPMAASAATRLILGTTFHILLAMQILCFQHIPLRLHLEPGVYWETVPQNINLQQVWDPMRPHETPWGITIGISFKIPWSIW